MADQPAELKHIPPTRIERNPENPRLIFRQEEMEKLLFSIDRHGIQVPLAVYKEGNGYQLIDGERRWRCALKLNLKTVPALVQEKPSPLANLLLMYNIHALREQWDYYTIASKLTRVIELFVKERGWQPNEVELSDAIGGIRNHIANYRNLGHHWPKNKKLARKKYLDCRHAFLDGMRQMVNFRKAMRDLGLSGNLPKV